MVSEDAVGKPGRLFTLSKGHPASNACVNALVLTPEVIGPSIFQLVLERSSFFVNGMRLHTHMTYIFEVIALVR